MGSILKKRLKQTTDVNTETEVVLNLFITSGFLRKKYDDLCNKYGITLPQYNVLRILNGVYPEGHPRCEIITRMIEPAPDVTRILDKLVKEKLVERFFCEEDRRLSKAKISEKGIKLLQTMRSDIDKLDLEIADRLSESEMKMISEICEKIYKEEV